jgi:hypothetical protein
LQIEFLFKPKRLVRIRLFLANIFLTAAIVIGNLERVLINEESAATSEDLQTFKEGLKEL